MSAVKLAEQMEDGHLRLMRNPMENKDLERAEEIAKIFPSNHKHSDDGLLCVKGSCWWRPKLTEAIVQALQDKEREVVEGCLEVIGHDSMGCMLERCRDKTCNLCTRSEIRQAIKAKYPSYEKN